MTTHLSSLMEDDSDDWLWPQPPVNIFDPQPPVGPPQPPSVISFPPTFPGAPPGRPEAGPGGSTIPWGSGNISIPGGGGSINVGGGNADLASLISLIGGGAVSHQQAEAFSNMSDQFLGMGAPYREQLLNLQNDPTSYLNSPAVTGAVQGGTDALARSLSVGGNPAGSGSALAEIQRYATNEQLNRLCA